MPNNIRNDKGVTLVEISIATFIMSLSLLAIIGLFVSAVKAATMAKNHTIATEFANKKVEEIRGLAYEKIGIVGGTGGTPAGELPPSEDATLTGNIPVTITYNVVWVDDPKDGTGSEDTNVYDYKRLTMVITWDKDDGSANLTVTTNIREKEHETAPPVIEWDYESPYNMQVIYGTVLLKATAEDSDGTIDTISFYCSGRRISNHGPFGISPATASSNWDTTALITADESTENAGQPKYPDGIREIRTEAYDNLGKNDFRVRYVIIDNYPPFFENPSTTLSTGFSTNTSIALNWTLARDGTDSSHKYNIYFKKSEEATWNALGSNPVEVSVGSYLVTGLEINTYYDFYIEAVGMEPRNLTSEPDSNIVTDKTQIEGGQLAYVDLYKIEKLLTQTKAQYTLFFNGPDYADIYKVYQSESYSGPFTDVTASCEISIGNPSVAIHSNQNKTKQFYYYVEAFSTDILVGRSDVREAPYP